MEEIDTEIANLIVQLIALLRRTDRSRTKSTILWILMGTTSTSYEALGLLCMMEKQLLEHWDDLVQIVQEVRNRHGVLER